MMTKKDFELIATAIRGNGNKGCWECYRCWEDIAEDLATRFAKTNPRFDEAKFLEAAGVEQ